MTRPRSPIPTTGTPLCSGPSEWSRRDFLRVAVSVAAVPAFIGCSQAPTQAITGSPRLTAHPVDPTESVPTGLSQLGLGAGSERDGYLYVPTTYDPDVATPLFVALHGAGQSAAFWDTYQTRAETRGMVLLVPESRGLTWDLLSGQLGPDVSFIDVALQFTFTRCRIDPQHIALGGFSDGASYALSLGLSNGDLFTHLVAYSPGFLQTVTPIVGQPRIFASHGTADPILPFSNTRDHIVPALTDAGYDVTFKEFTGGHGVPADVSEAALDWFLA